MLYNLLFMAISMLIPITAILAYRQGIKDAQALAQNKALPAIIKAPQRKPRTSEQDERFNTILDNINNYDGTDIGQREV